MPVFCFGSLCVRSTDDINNCNPQSTLSRIWYAWLVCFYIAARSSANNYYWMTLGFFGCSGWNMYWTGHSSFRNRAKAEVNEHEYFVSDYIRVWLNPCLKHPWTISTAFSWRLYSIHICRESTHTIYFESFALLGSWRIRRVVILSRTFLLEGIANLISGLLIHYLHSR